MNTRIANFGLEGKTVLGFDTGLNAQAFAQAKMAQFITSTGTIVYPDGKTETWQPEGVAEKGTMVIFGPSFPGERLDAIINGQDQKDDALDAVSVWIRAALILEKEASGGEAPYPGPAGALMVSSEGQEFPRGTILFPPFRLLKRSLEADNAVSEAECWVHPDLRGKEAISFSAGAMFYRIFCGSSPFQGDKTSAGQKKASEISLLDELRQDIREGVFMPPELAAPGLQKEMAAAIAASMSSVSRNREEKIRPSPETILDLAFSSPRRPVSSWVTPPSGEELSRISLEREQYRKKNAFTVKTRRFVIRNTAIIAV